MMLKKLSVLLVLTAVSAGSAGAQALLSDCARAELAEENRRFLRPGTLAFGAVGALIGAGTGFFVSQIMHSDWEKISNSTFATHRRNFALTGAGVGLISAFLLEGGDTGGPGLRVYGMGAGRQGSGGAITLTELRESSVQNAYEAVASLRPQWLVARGETIGSFGTLIPPSDGDAEGPQTFTAIPGEERIGAFLDGMVLDGIQSLRGIPILSVERIEFRTASVGGQSGPGYIHRAIVVISADGTTR